MYQRSPSLLPQQNFFRSKSRFSFSPFFIPVSAFNLTALIATGDSSHFDPCHYTRRAKPCRR